MHTLIFSTLLLVILATQATQAPITPPGPQTDSLPVSSLSSNADPDCPINSLETSRVVNRVLQRQLASTDNPPFSLDVAISCYQLENLSKPSYALMVQFQRQGQEPVTFRRIGVLPGRAPGDGDFLLQRLDSALAGMIADFLKQHPTD